MTRMNNNKSEAGNVFLIIILAVALFGTLAFVVSRGMRSETATGISRRQAELAAVDTLDYAQRMERAIAKIRSRGTSENDIDFTNAKVTGYAHTPVQPGKNQVFNKAGGGVSWKDPHPKSNDGSPWLFTGGTCIVDVGTGGAGCGSNGQNDEELVAVLPNMNLIVCEEINRRLNVGAMPSGGGFSNTKFTGTYGDGNSPPTTDLNSACFTTGGNYYFYYVLLAR
jgi:hypothetical protein